MTQKTHYDDIFEKNSFVKNSHLVCINSAICTGTHLVKFILEESEFFEFCINEQRRDEKDVPLQDSMLAMISGCMKKFEFYEKALSQLTKKYEDIRINQHKSYTGREIKKDRSKIKYLLYHCHSNYMTRKEIFSYPFHSFIIPIRHPMLSVISILRRHRSKLGGEVDKLIYEYIFCTKHIWSLDFPMYVFVNPWEVIGFGRVFKRLEVSMNEELRNMIASPPVINETIVKDDSGKHIFAHDRSGNTDLLKAKEAFLSDGTIAPQLIKYYEMIQQSGLMRVYLTACEKGRAKAGPQW